MAKIYKGVVGLLIKLNTHIDLTDVVDQSIVVLTPRLVETEWAAYVIGGTHYLGYRNTALDLATAGDYKLQAWIKKTDDSEFLGETATLTISETFT